ncbi:MAG: hypothetical protein RL660_69 [Bacteroidota bacterium]
MFARISTYFILLPTLFDLGFVALVVRFKLRFGNSPLINPIDPKEIGMPIHVSTLDLLWVLTLLTSPIYLYFLFRFVRRPKSRTAYFLCYTLVLGLFFYWLFVSKYALWFID